MNTLAMTALSATIAHAALPLGPVVPLAPLPSGVETALSASPSEQASEAPKIERSTPKQDLTDIFERAGSSASAPLPIDLDTVVRIQAEPAGVLPGITRPDQEVTLSTQFDSMLARLLVTEGQTVRAGDPIAVLDDRVARSSLRLAEQAASNTAELERTSAALDRAEAVLARTEKAIAADAAADDELDSARSQVTIARAEHDAAAERFALAQLERELAEARLEQHMVRAPFDATILRLRTEPGSVLATKDPIADLASLNRVLADLHVPAATPLETGAHYALQLGAPLNAVLPARLRYIENRIEPTSRTRRAVFEFGLERGAPTVGLLVTPADRLPTPLDLAKLEPDQTEMTQPSSVAVTSAVDAMSE